MQINLVVGVDFTGSNGDPSSPSSLHYIYGQEPNEYERAIRSTGNILAHYDYDQKFPLLGFGGIPQGGSMVEHVFPLNYNFDGEPLVNGVNEMVKVYKEALTKTTLYGPTNFSPLIINTAKFSKMKGPESYVILLIITDGEINDEDETIDAIIDASDLPISIVIVGVGNHEFSKMEILDAEEIPLSNSKMAMTRNTVHFVPFRRFEKNGEKLAAQILLDIPDQVDDFYRGKNIVFNKTK